MSLFEEVVAQLHAALRNTTTGREHVLRAITHLDAALTDLADALQGSNNPTAPQLLASLTEAQQILATAYRAAQAAESTAHRYLTHIGGAVPGAVADPPARSPSPASVSTSDPAPPPTDERIEQIRADLPPQVVANSGQKTHGRWIDPNGVVRTLVSARDELYRRVNELLADLDCPAIPATAAADVELRLVMIMREQGKTDPRMRHVTLVLNNVPCVGRMGCTRLISVLLPDGYSLTVHGPNYRRRFTGGGRPWWR
jgi:hypothetical protein